MTPGQAVVSTAWQICHPKKMTNPRHQNRTMHFFSTGGSRCWTPKPHQQISQNITFFIQLSETEKARNAPRKMGGLDFNPCRSHATGGDSGTASHCPVATNFRDFAIYWIYTPPSNSGKWRKWNKLLVVLLGGGWIQSYRLWRENPCIKPENRDRFGNTENGLTLRTQCYSF